MAIVLVSAAPASAVAPLPDGDTLYAIPCHSDLTLKLVNPDDSTWVDVGTQPAIGTVECAYQPAFNPVTGQSFYLGGNTMSGEWPLLRVDTTTGVSTVVHEIWDGTTNLNIGAGADFPGNMLITNAGVAYFLGGTRLHALDLDTATIGAQIGPDIVIVGDIYATACSPVNASCYILTEIGSLYSLDPATAAVALLGTVPVGGNYSLQVASDGTLWSSSNGGHVSSFSAADPAATFVQGNATAEYSGAYLITRAPAAAPAAAAPALAASGDEGAGVLLAASGLFALGGILIVGARRRRSLSN